MMTENISNRDIQRVQMDLLIELDRICSILQIPYFLMDGSLIGAVRHNGFIPWDDDIDVGMLREDYEIFANKVNSVIDDSYIFFSWVNDKNYPLPFGKIRVKGTLYVEEESKNTAVEKGIFLDVFPLDNAAPSMGKQRIQEKKVRLYQKILQLKMGWNLYPENVMKRCLYLSCRILGIFKATEFWKQRLDNELKKYNQYPSDYRVNMCGAYSFQKVKQKEYVFRELIRHDFEGYKVLIPKNYDLYLTKVYGDYMKLPDKDKRVGKHGVIKKSLGNYKIRCDI